MGIQGDHPEMLPKVRREIDKEQGSGWSTKRLCNTKAGSTSSQYDSKYLLLFAAD